MIEMRITYEILAFNPIIRLWRKFELKRRIKIAEELVEHLEEAGVKVIAWKVTGSTKRGDFGFTSDLDIDILTESGKDEELAREMMRKFQRIYLEKRGLLIDYMIDNLEHIEKIPKLKEIVEKYYGIT